MCGCESYLRGVSPHAVDVGAELGVLDAVHLHDIDGGFVHAVVFVCQFIPGRLYPLAVATPGPQSVKIKINTVRESWYISKHVISGL